MEEEEVFNGHCQNLDIAWNFERADGNVETYVFPVAIEWKEEKPMVLQSTLPDYIEKGGYLCLLVRRSTCVYIDGKERLHFDESKAKFTGGFVKSHYMLVELSPEDRGKEITIQREQIKQDVQTFNEILYGDKIGIVKHLFAEQGLQFMAACILFVFSAMLCLIGCILFIVYKRRMYVILLAFGMMCGSLWFIFDSFLYQIIFGNYHVDGPMEYMLLMLLPFFFNRYLNNEQGRRHEKIFFATDLLLMLNFIVHSALHFLKISSYEDNILKIDLCIAIWAVLIIGTIVSDIVKGYVKQYVLVAMGFLMILLFGILQIVVMLTQEDNHNALVLLMGMYMMLVFGCIHTILFMVREEEKAENAREESVIKSRFLANMSHEVRTPINAILGMNEMILRKSSEDLVRRYSTQIKNASNNLLDIVNDILDFSKIEAGKMDIVEAPYKLSRLLGDVKNIIEVRANEKKLNFFMEVDERLPENFLGDEGRIRQVLLNLLNNAVKYTQKGSVTLRVSMKELEEWEQDARSEYKTWGLRLDIEDTGIGIREEDMERLFGTFQRLDVQKNKSIEGTGLGLAITDNLVQLMNGRLLVKSQYGKGSVFTVEVPQQIIGKKRIGNLEQQMEKKWKESAGYEAAFVAPDARVLVVDDVSINVEIIKELLKDTKVQCTGVCSGKEALALCKKQDYDVILMDHIMPEMDGIETLHQLKEQCPNLCPVVVLTANAIEGMRNMYIAEGFSDYLTKPVFPEQLENVLKKYIER